MPQPSLLRTHPPTEERINRLLALYEAAPSAPWPGLVFPTGSAPFGPVLGGPSDWAAMSHAPRWRWPGVWY